MLKIQPDLLVGLPQIGTWPETVHVFDEDSQWAINAALAANRPLLIRGEPGCGKSQLARAAAHCLKRAFISSVVHARTSCEDLQYHFDAVARLGEAQTIAARGMVDDVHVLLDPLNFLSPGPLWWVFDYQGAKLTAEKGRAQHQKPIEPEAWNPDQGCVLLIDEIDKAEADLPNGLLETLGNGAFTVPFLSEPVGGHGNTRPLVIITTNEERELPAAFTRRCLVLHLAPPSREDKLVEWLMARGKAHFGVACSDEVRKQAADQLVDDRKTARDLGLPQPGQAEYLDLLRALVELDPDLARAGLLEEKQLAVLKRLAMFTLGKYREQL